MFHNYSDEDVEVVIKNAGLDELVKALPKGINSKVNENDNNLAMQIENLILEKKELTAIVVTHKLIESILKKYDCIITLNHGQVVECGSFHELMNNKRYFYSLFTISK